MFDEEAKLAVYIGLLAQGLFSAFFGLLGFLEGQQRIQGLPLSYVPYALPYFSAPLIFGLSCVLLAILVIIMDRILLPDKVSISSGRIGISLMWIGVTLHVTLTLIQVFPSWFSVNLLYPVCAAQSIGIVILVRYNMDKILSFDPRLSTAIWLLGMTLLGISLSAGFLTPWVSVDYIWYQWSWWFPTMLIGLFSVDSFCLIVLGFSIMYFRGVASRIDYLAEDIIEGM